MQECIEILKIAPDGIFEVAGNRYSKSYLFSDVNYNTTSEAEQVGIFESYCKFFKRHGRGVQDHHQQQKTEHEIPAGESAFPEKG